MELVLLISEEGGEGDGGKKFFCVDTVSIIHLPFLQKREEG